jgi:hypothetical protein
VARGLHCQTPKYPRVSAISPNCPHDRGPRALSGVPRAVVIASDPLLRDHMGEASCGPRGTGGPSHDRLRTTLSMLLFGVGVIVIGRLLAKAGISAVLSDVTQAGPRLLLVFAAPLVAQFLHLLGWMLLLPSAARPNLLRAYRVFLAAQAGNELGIGLLGEPLKVIALRKRDKAAATAAVVLDNATCFVALVAFFVTVGAVAWPFPARGVSLGRPALGVSAAIAVALLLCWLGSRRHWGKALSRGAPMLFVFQRVQRAWLACCAVLRDRPGRVASAFLLHYAAKLWIIVEFAVVLHLFGRDSFHLSALLGIASAGASVLGAPVPGQVGVVESAVVVAASSSGIPHSVALTIVLLRRIRGCFWMLVGALLVPSTKDRR